MPPTPILTTTYLDVVRGGQPDEDDGFDLRGCVSPNSTSLTTRPCACRRVALIPELWDLLDRHDLYSSDSPLWLRTQDAEADFPLSSGAVLLDRYTLTHTVH